MSHIYTVLIGYFSSSYTTKPTETTPMIALESGLGTMSLSTGTGTLSLSTETVSSATGGVIASSASLPLDLSSGGSILAGLPASPMAISDTCKLFVFSL